MDLPAAEKAIRQGSNLGFMLTTLWLFSVVVAIIAHSVVAVDLWDDLWKLLDVAIVGGLAFGIRRRSRTCAIGLTAFYVISRTSLAIAEERMFCVVVPAVMTFYFAKSIEGTVVYHRLRRQQDPEYRAAAKWTYWLLIPGTAVVVLMVALAIVGSLALPTAVVGGDEMKPSHEALLRERGVLLEGEQVVMFYSNAMFSILDDGNMLTNSRVVSYETIDGQLFVYDAAYEDIVEVTVLPEGSSFWGITMIEITTSSEESFYVLVSTESGGDKRFLADLESRIDRPREILPVA